MIFEIVMYKKRMNESSDCMNLEEWELFDSILKFYC